MQSNFFSIALLWACASCVALGVPFAGENGVLRKKADIDKVGYLAAYWKTNETGIFFALSTNDDPLAFSPINGGEALFVPTLGQKTVRDLSIVPGGGEEEGSKWYLLATDLNIEDYSSWDAASANGSKALLIWDSSDLVKWTDERLITVEQDTAGMAWAPDAIYDAAKGQYLVHWASQFFAADDTAHAAAPIQEAVMRYAHTPDFRTFSAPQTYLDRNPNSTIDLGFLPINATALVRFWAHDGVHTEVGFDGLFGAFEEVGEVITGYEGAYAFWDNARDGVAYLTADKVGSDAGIRGFGPADPANGVWVLDEGVDDAYMRHGSVFAVTQEQYDALAAV